jgi:hypothetical protein
MPNGRKRKIVEGLDDAETYRDISIKVKLGRLRPSPDLRAAIEDATCRVQDIVARGLLLANHTLVRELAFGRFPDITNQSWWLQCIKIWGTLEIQRGPPPKIDPRVREAYNTLKDRPGMSQVPMHCIVHTINQVVEILMANAWTHVAQNFHNFLRKAFQREFSIFETDVRKLTDKERNCARESAMNHCTKREIFWEPVVGEDLRRRLESVYLPWTRKYGPVGDAQNIRKEDCPELIQWMADLLAHRDRCAVREDVDFYKGCMRTHRLIPLGSLKVRHILITKTVFKEELLPLARRIRRSTTSKDLDPAFEDYFPGITKLKPCPGSVFTDYFATDGVSVSLRYKKPVSVPMSAVIKRYKKDKGFVTVEGQDMRSAHPPRLPREGDRLIAIDPGRRDVVFGSVYGSEETVRLSTGQLCHDSGRRWNKRQSDKVFSKIKHRDTTLAEAKSNLPCSRTSSWVAWETFISEYVPLMQPTLDAWKKKCFRKTAFWCYGKRDKCLDALCKDITGGVRGTLVAFGGAASCSTGFGYAPVPQKRLRARLEKIHGARVSIIGECYTSQICSQCKRFLKPFYVGEDNIWALKRCSHCQSSRGTDLVWNRDRNASLNIMSIYMQLARTGARPVEFQPKRH